MTQTRMVGWLLGAAAMFVVGCHGHTESLWDSAVRHDLALKGIEGTLVADRTSPDAKTGIMVSYQGPDPWEDRSSEKGHVFYVLIPTNEDGAPLKHYRYQGTSRDINVIAKEYSAQEPATFEPSDREYYEAGRDVHGARFVPAAQGTPISVYHSADYPGIVVCVPTKNGASSQPDAMNRVPEGAWVLVLPEHVRRPTYDRVGHMVMAAVVSPITAVRDAATWTKYQMSNTK